MPTNEMKLAVIETSLAHIQAEIREIKDSLDTMKAGFVTKDQFEPVRVLTSLILIAIIGGVIAIILNK